MTKITAIKQIGSAYWVVVDADSMHFEMPLPQGAFNQDQIVKLVNDEVLRKKAQQAAKSLMPLISGAVDISNPVEVFKANNPTAPQIGEQGPDEAVSPGAH